MVRKSFVLNFQMYHLPSIIIRIKKSKRNDQFSTYVIQLCIRVRSGLDFSHALYLSTLRSVLYSVLVLKMEYKIDRRVALYSGRNLALSWISPTKTFDSTSVRLVLCFSTENGVLDRKWSIRVERCNGRNPALDSRKQFQLLV